MQQLHLQAINQMLHAARLPSRPSLLSLVLVPCFWPTPLYHLELQWF